MRRSLVLAAAVAAAATATCATAQQRPPIVVNPDWQHRPSLKEVEDAFPPMARLLDIEGYAVLSCDVLASGRLSACDVQEKPAGLGFGDAALALSTAFRMKPKTIDGAPTDDGTVRIPIRFTLPPDVAEGRAESLAPRRSPQIEMELARELGVLSGAEAGIKAILAEQFEDFDTNGRAGVVPSAFEEGAALAAEVRAKLAARLLEGHALLLAANLSQTELETLVALHRRPGVVAMESERDAVEKRSTLAFDAFWSRTLNDARAQVCRGRKCDSPLDVAAPVEAAWAEKPSQAALQLARPAVPEMLRLSGHADLRCASATNGALERCRIVTETPRGFGFGEAALSVVALYRLKTPLAAGEGMALRVKFPIYTPEPPPARKTPTLSAAQREVLAQRLTVFMNATRQARRDELMEMPNLGSNRVLIDDALEAAEAAALSNLPQLIDDQAVVYAEIFSPAELEDIFALWASPANQKLERLWVENDAAWDAYANALRIEAWAEARAAFCQRRDCEAPPRPQ